MSHILVTGGAGFIGRHVVSQLLRYGYVPVVYDINVCDDTVESLTCTSNAGGGDGASDTTSTTTATNITTATTAASGKPIMIKGNVLDTQGLVDVFATYNFVAVIHMAALKSVPESVNEPLKYYSTNVTGTLNVLQAMSIYGVNAFIFSSSATVYAPQNRPVVETDALAASNPYGHTKLMMEQVIHDYAVAHTNFRAMIFRYFNPIGSGDSGCTNIVPVLRDVLAGKRQYVSVMAEPAYDTADGTGIRDYIHVTDVAFAHILALKKMLVLPGAQTLSTLPGAQTLSTLPGAQTLSVLTNTVTTLNLGTGTGVSVLDIIKMAQTATGKNIPYRITPRRPGDVAMAVSDPTAATRVLGWVAVGSLISALRDALVSS